MVQRSQQVELYKLDMVMQEIGWVQLIAPEEK